MKRFITALILCIYLCTGCVFAYADDSKYGYDVSHNNDVLSDDVLQSGKDFVMIRLGYSTNHLDKNFYENVKAAYENKIPFGVYFYSYAYDSAEAKEDAEFVIETLSSISEYSEYLTLPVALDLEDAQIPQHCDKKQITEQMRLFCDAIETAGYVPMVYANAYWFNNYIDTAVIKNNGYKVWYAYYPSGNIDFSKKISVGNTGLTADMWQYKKGSNTDKTLDENIAYSFDELTHIYKYSNTVKATVKENGAAIYKCSRCCKEKQEIIYSPKTFKLSKTSYTYDGKAKKPTITVKDSKGNSISNYSVTYKSNKNVGTASAVITLKGNYSGIKTLTYKINPKNTKITKLSKLKKGFKADIKKYTTQTTGYQLQYSTDKNFKKNVKTVSVSNKTTSKSVKKLKGGKRYYVRLRTYKTVGKTKYYSSWSAAKSVVTRK